MDSDSTIWQSTPPTLNATVAWQPAPKFRSTSNILISCLSTFFICVWSALHVDIATGRSTWMRYQSKLGWVFVGLFCPELLFYIAFNQFKMALLLTIKAHEYLPVADDVKEGETAQRPKLPRSYRLLEQWLELTDESTNSELRRNAESSGGAFQREDASTESSHRLESEDSGLNDVPLSEMRQAGAEVLPVPQSPPVSESQVPLLRASSPGSTASPSPVPGSSRAIPGSSLRSVRTSTTVRRHRWTLAHGFYAAMGGFVLKDPYGPRAPDHYLPAWQRNGVLTPSGVFLLMKVEPSLIPDLAYEDIVSFGKADAIAKVLLILQVSWFLITCILRHAQGLPLTLLEITTIAHAACTLLTYFLWWAKPKDVEHQTIIDCVDARLLGAWMSMASPACRYLFGGFLQRSFPSEMYENPSQGFQRSNGHVSFHCEDSLASSLKIKFIFGETTVPWYWHQDSPQSLEETNANQERWALAYQAMEKYSDSLPAELDDTQYVTPTASLQAYTIKDDYDAADSPSTHFLVVTLLIGAVYGLPHLIGFTVTFASANERTLWLVATVLVATMGLGLLVIAVLAVFAIFILDKLAEYLTSKNLRYVERYVNKLFSVIFMPIAILYVCSSGYLVFESIRQLFALPPAAFDLPSWGRYWPHFS